MTPRGVLLRGPLVLGGARLEAGALLIEAGEVRWSGPAAQLPAELGAAREVTLAPDAGTLVPGFVDLHVHGAAGADAADGSAASLETICRAHAAHGTTALCPTVLTAPPRSCWPGWSRFRRWRGGRRRGARG